MMVSTDTRTPESTNNSDHLLRLLVVSAMVSFVVIVLFGGYVTNVRNRSNATLFLPQLNSLTNK